MSVEINGSYHYIYFDGTELIAVPLGSHSRSFSWDDDDYHYVGYFDYQSSQLSYSEANQRCQDRSEMRKQRLVKTVVAGVTTNTSEVIYVCEFAD